MIDYGALQPSPVGRVADNNHLASSTLPPIREGKAPVYQSHHPDNKHHLPPPQAIVSPAPTATPSTYAPSFVSPGQHAQLALDDEPFELDFGFDFSSNEVEAMMMNATQEFWVSFPGEVGAGFT
jgi:hypothetical protein